MNKNLLLLLIVILAPEFTLAQAVKTTSVTINATDSPDTQAWSNGSYSTNLVLNPGTSTATSSPGPSGALDGSGNATFVLTSENDITFPKGGKWQVTVCPQMGCTLGTLAPVNLAYTQQIPSTLGSSVSLNLTPPSPRIPVYTLRPTNAYRDSEIISSTLGSEYFNISTNALKFCQLLPCTTNWNTIGSGGGGGGNPFFSSLLPSTNTNPGNFVSTGSTWDFSGASLVAPVGANASPTTNGTFAYDSVAGTWKFAQGGSAVSFGRASSPCASNFFVSTPATATSGATCSQPSFSGLSGTVNLATQVTGLLPHANIASTAVTPGSYTNTNITVAADGSITAASNGSAASGASFPSSAGNVLNDAVCVQANATQNLVDCGFPPANIPTSASAHTYLGNNTGSTGSANGYVPLGTSDITPNLYCVTTGSTNVYVATLTPAATAMTQGLLVNFLPNNTNTSTTPTLNVNGLGAKTIVKSGGLPLVPGDILTTQIATVVYDGTNFQLINPATTRTMWPCAPQNSTTDTVTSAVSGTETFFTTVCKIPANTFITGRVIHGIIGLDYTATSSIPNFTFSMMLCTTLQTGGPPSGCKNLYKSTTTAPSSGTFGLSMPFVLQATTAAGSTATLSNAISAGVGANSPFGRNTVPSTVGNVATNGDLYIEFTAAFSTNAASNSMTLTNLEFF